MSSASSGRYKSKLFNFVHHQSRRLTEQSERAFRHLQVATSWVTTLVLYPIYLLFRSNRAVGKMHQAVQQSSLQLPADDNDSQPQISPTADTPIQRVLPYKALAFLDRTFADLESNQLAPVSEVAIALGKRSWELLKRVQTQLATSLSGIQPAHIKSPALAPDGSEANTFRIQALIWAAIDYFFGRRSGLQLKQTTPTSDSLELPTNSKPRGKQLPHRRSATPVVQFGHDVDPWLTLSDLFGDSELEGEPSTPQAMSQVAGKTKPALPSSQSAGYSLRNLLNPFVKAFGLRFQTFLPQSKQAFGLVKRQSSLTAEKFSRQLPPRRLSAGEISNQPRSQSTQLTPAPEWIETNATAMGYVKHPLEQLLEWLDQAMLWLEELLISVLQWVQSLWRGK